MLKVVSAFIGAATVAAVVMTSSAPVRAQLPPPPLLVPDPCDFITGGGFIATSGTARASFGAHAGCKQQAFWGHVSYVDHAGFLNTTPYHVTSTAITGYIFIDSNTRGICGIATTNAGETGLIFLVQMQDNAGSGMPDRFGIALSNGYIQTIRDLAGGNIQLHKDNPSTSAPNPLPDLEAACKGGIPQE